MIQVLAMVVNEQQTDLDVQLPPVEPAYDYYLQQLRQRRCRGLPPTEYT